MAPAAAALPVVKTLRECVDFSKTVLPFLPQLEELPSKILDSISSAEDLKTVYLETNPLMTAIAFVLFVSPLFWIASEINKNYSQVDRFWSLLPSVFIGHFVTWAHWTGLPTRRLDNICAFSMLWSLRLTFNYWRRGGYQIGAEDYRWQIVRSKISKPLFFAFNVVFISFLQIVLLLLVTTPTYVFLIASQISGNELSTADLVFSRALLGLIAIETFADQQQWNYHQAKAKYQKTAKVPPEYSREELDRGFCTNGLWAWSRHPNFAAEQAIWFTLYQWGCYETFTYVNWTLTGAMFYLFLFQGSTWLTERITAGKYPEYKDYQKRVSRFLPKVTTAFTGPVRKAGDTSTGRASAVTTPDTSNKPVTRSATKSSTRSRKKK